MVALTHEYPLEQPLHPCLQEGWICYAGLMGHSLEADVILPIHRGQRHLVFRQRPQVQELFPGVG
eukprot:1127903-Pelagomonas_calceolata.AAC.2